MPFPRTFDDDMWFSNILGVDSPLFSTIVLSKTSCLHTVFGGFLERRIPGKNGEATLRNMLGRVPDPHRETSALAVGAGHAVLPA